MSGITLLRHGATTAGRRYCGSTDTPLSEEGWRQMWRAVAGKCWTRIVTSPLRRCAGFAQALASERSIPIEIDERWREMHFGDWEGCSAAELFVRTPPAIENFWRDPLSYPPPNAEPLHELESRTLQALDSLSATSGDENVLVVTHGGPIRIVLAQRDRIALRNLLQIEVAHAQMISVEWIPACVHS